MGENSKIEWTDHTFNPWRGCTKVSPGCAHCYAERLAKRNPGVLGIWGDDGIRVVASEAAWKETYKWDQAARKAGNRCRVFCASLSDVFEDRPELVPHRVRLFHYINATPNLDWLLLTKRPENIGRFLGSIYNPGSWSRIIPPNVWLGVSVEDRKHGLPRVDALRKLPAAIHFLSVEPLLEDLGEIDLAGIGWVIVGGESGPNSRPMHPQWVQSIRDQCQSAGVPYFFKQWGEWVPGGAPVGTLTHWVHASGLHYGTGEHIRGDKSPVEAMSRVGKKAAGRMLDGRTWDELPTPREVATR